jgi:hypothetical protein
LQSLTRVEAPGIERPCTERSAVQGRLMSGGMEQGYSPCSEVEAPGIEPGSENVLLAHLRT